MIQWNQEMLLPHLIDHIFRWNSNIVRCSALLNLGQHRFIGVKGFIDDFNAGLLFKAFNQIRVNIISPVINGECVFARIAL